MTQSLPKANYHHGDLRQALLDAAASIIRAHGVEALTLRGVTRALGVAHTAPKHHFGDLDGLITALATEQFKQHLERMEAACGLAKPDPKSQIAAAGRGYLEHVQRSGKLFELQFNSSRPNFADPAYQTHANAAFAFLVGLVERAFPELPEDQRQAKLRQIWAQIHGLALLFVTTSHTFGGTITQAARAAEAALLFDAFVERL